MGEAKLKDFMNPSVDFMRTKPGLIEVTLRSASVGLPLITLFAASLCQDYLGVFVGTLVAQTYSILGWLISLSYCVVLYQLIAIAQLFLRVRLGYANVLCCSLFYFMDIIATLVVAGGYLYGGVFMYLLNMNWSQLASNNAHADVVGSINTAATTTTTFSFIALLISVGLVIYFYLARYVYRWPTHGERPDSSQYL